MNEPPYGYRFEQGFLWPEQDIRCAQYIFKSVRDLHQIYDYCRKFEVVIQAGGNCGIWPRELGLRFQRVYTFEPCSINFRCLAANAPAENIYKFNAALGERPGLLDLVRDPKNVGAHYIAKTSGQIPTMRIDDLALDTCDLVLLDIEGFEFQALSGGIETIRNFNPVVVVENRGYSRRYGIDGGKIEELLSNTHSVVAKSRYDLILAPKS
jgi:FkbM family methyltransferase